MNAKYVERKLSKSRPRECPECRSEHMVVDSTRAEVYCENCGLVICNAINALVPDRAMLRQCERMRSCIEMNTEPEKLDNTTVREYMESLLQCAIRITEADLKDKRVNIAFMSAEESISSWQYFATIEEMDSNTFLIRVNQRFFSVDPYYTDELYEHVYSQIETTVHEVLHAVDFDATEEIIVKRAEMSMEEFDKTGTSEIVEELVDAYTECIEALTDITDNDSTAV